MVKAIGPILDHSVDYDPGSGSVVLMAENLVRQFLLVQNLSESDKLYLTFGGNALTTHPSIILGPLAILVFDQDFIPSQSVNVIAEKALSITAKEA